MSNNAGFFRKLLSTLPIYRSERSVLGGQTDVTLTAAPTLASLGVGVAPLGAATLDASGAAPVASFPITGGTEDGVSGGAVYLHENSGLELSDSAGTVDLENFRVDTQNHFVFSDVTVDGSLVGTVATFRLAGDGELKLTGRAAKALDAALGTDALTPGLAIGTGAPQPVDNRFSALLGLPVVDHVLSQRGGHTQSPTGTDPIVGGETEVDLTSAGTLASLGVSVATTGFASLDASGATPAAFFPVTGGTEDPATGLARVLHQGSGLTLSDANGSLSLSDFFVDSFNSRTYANVTADGEDAGNQPVFNIGQDGSSLTLTKRAAATVDRVLGTDAITNMTPIGQASVDVVPGPSAILNYLHPSAAIPGLSSPQPHGLA